MSDKFTLSAGLNSAGAMIGVAWKKAGLVLALMALAYTVFGGNEGPLGNPAMRFLGIACYVVLSIASTGALFRASTITSPHLKAQDIGPGGLQWRSTEWAILRAAMVVLLFVVLAALIAVLVVGGLLTAMGVDLKTLAALADPQAAEIAMRDPALQKAVLILGLVLLISYGLLIWIMVRLSLVTAATAATGKVQVFSTMKLTKGQFWRLLGGFIITALPSVLISGIVGGLVGATSATGGQISQGAMWGIAAAAGLVGAFISAPMQTGLIAEAYKRLTQKPEDIF